MRNGSVRPPLRSQFVLRQNSRDRPHGPWSHRLSDFADDASGISPARRRDLPAASVVLLAQVRRLYVLNGKYMAGRAKWRLSSGRSLPESCGRGRKLRSGK